MVGKIQDMSSLGEILSHQMAVRKFLSDEQLVQKAMVLQRGKQRRLNIHARTISNWRRNVTTPRSAQDEKLKYILMALQIESDGDLAHIEKLIAQKWNSDPVASHQAPQSGSIPAQQSIESAPSKVARNSEQDVQPKKNSAMLLIAGLVAFIVAIGLSSYALGIWGEQEVYVDVIPPLQLRLTEGGFVIGDSDERLLTQEELEPLTGWELYVARNEIFARKGRKFVRRYSQCLQQHFNSWSTKLPGDNGWYIPRSGEPRLNKIEEQNVRLILSHECNKRGGQYRCTGQLHPC